MTKVSIVIPMHDSMRFLAEALASIEMQTLQDIEVICVDDASTDGTRALCAEYARQYPRIKLIAFPENRGVSAARNAGMKAATGDYIAFMDDDDFYPESETLEKLYGAAASCDAPIAGGSFSEYDNRTGRVADDYRGCGHLSCFTLEERGPVAYRDWQGDFGFQRFIFKRSLLIDQGIEFPPLRRHEDPVFLVRAMVAAGWFYAMPDVVYRYRYHHKPRMLAPETIDEAIEGISCILAIAYDNGLETLRAYQVELLKAYAADYFGLVAGEGRLLQVRGRFLRDLNANPALRRLLDGAAAVR